MSLATPTARRPQWHGGWWSAAQRLDSPNCGDRPARSVVDLVVLHSISLPPGVYGGPAIAALFMNRLDPADDPSFAELAGLRVSAHFVLRRDGQLWQFVSCDRRAWHAGQSSWRARPNCNDYSVGIELEGLEGEPFDDRQYPALVDLMRGLARRYPLRDVVGHEHVAPGRKGDPGAGFDWARLRATLDWPAVAFAG